MKEQKRRRTFKRRSTKSRILLILLCIALLVTAGVAGGVLAKYVREYSAKDSVIPSSFVFRSDYLVEGGKTYNVYGTSAAITLYNNDGLNTAESNITYSVTATGGTVTGAGTSLTGNTNSSKTFTLTGAIGSTITVTATATAPYTKTISATFVFNQDTANYKITDNGNHVVLDVYTAETAINGVTISFGSNFAPDNNNELMSSWTSGTGGTVNFAANSHYTFVFFKKTTAVYTTKTGNLVSSATISI